MVSKIFAPVSELLLLSVLTVRLAWIGISDTLSWSLNFEEFQQCYVILLFVIRSKLTNRHQGWARDTVDEPSPVPSRVPRDFDVFSHGSSGPSRPVKVKIQCSVPFLSRENEKNSAFFQVSYSIQRRFRVPPMPSMPTRKSQFLVYFGNFWLFWRFYVKFLEMPRTWVEIMAILGQCYPCIFAPQPSLTQFEMFRLQNSHSNWKTWLNRVNCVCVCVRLV